MTSARNNAAMCNTEPKAACGETNNLRKIEKLNSCGYNIHKWKTDKYIIQALRNSKAKDMLI